MKATRCSVEECTKPACNGRGWCWGHYFRWRRTGDLHAQVPLQQRNPPQCTVDGCDNQAKSRGWCETHYSRWKRTGVVGGAEVWDHKPTICTIEGCEVKAYGLGMCRSHWKRGYLYGDPTRPLTGPGSAHWLTRDELTYIAAHMRVKRVRGRAKDYSCACGAQAIDWAYQHNDPDPLFESFGPEKGSPFSDDINCYAPMCRICHKRLDLRIIAEGAKRPDRPTRPGRGRRGRAVSTPSREEA